MTRKASDFLNVIKLREEQLKDHVAINVRVSEETYYCIQAIRFKSVDRRSRASVIEKYLSKVAKRGHIVAMTHKYEKQSYITKRIKVHLPPEIIAEIDWFANMVDLSRCEAASYLTWQAMQFHQNEFVYGKQYVEHKNAYRIY